MTEPWSRDAEQSVLGALMLSATAYHRIADTVGERDFFSSDHRAIWRAIAELAGAGQSCDAVTIGEQLEQQGRRDLVVYVIEITNATPGAANVVAYAEIVAAHAYVRRVRQAGREIAAMDAESVGGAAGVLAAAQSRQARAVVAMKDALRAWYEQLSERFGREGGITGLSTGLQALDDLTCGLQPGDLIVIGARPSMGKTAFALHLTRACAEADRRALVFSLEMPADQLLDRMISAVSRVPMTAIRNPKTIDEDAWPRISGAITRARDWPVMFDESGSIDVDTICARARQEHARAPLSLIVIDYLQLIRMRGSDSRNNDISEVTRALKLLAKALGVPVILLSQLNRSLEARSDKRPIMADLRESGAIEQDADVIVFLYRDEVYNSSSPDAGYTEVIIRKHRNGPLGMVPTRSEMRCGLYGDCDALPSAGMQDESPKGGRKGWSR